MLAEFYEVVATGIAYLLSLSVNLHLSKSFEDLDVERGFVSDNTR